MMELKSPKSKRSKFRLEPKSSLPLVFGNKGELTQFHANLTALGSCIADPIEIQIIHKMGYFGKGSLSKSHPSFGRMQQPGATPPVIRKRQWQRRQEWISDVQKLSGETLYGNNKRDSFEIHDHSTKDMQIVIDHDEDDNVSETSMDAESTLDNGAADHGSSNVQVLVLSDSDSQDDYLINIKPEIKYENCFPVRETLQLTAEETFFLMYGLGCLRVMDLDGKYLSIGQTWNYFCKEDAAFLQKYAVYHYFRSKGWVVKPGLKYGGDYLLYKEGPPFYHSSYIVMIDVLDAATSKRIEAKSVRRMAWNNFIGLHRLAETVRKEVLIAQVLWPASVSTAAPTHSTTTAPSSPETISQFTVREVLVKRCKFNAHDMASGASSGDDDDDDDDDDGGDDVEYNEGEED